MSKAKNIETVSRILKENVVQQIQHLRTHPAVAAKIATGQVKLHGWVYNIGTGEVLYYNTESGEFDVMDESTAEAQLARSE